MTGPGATARHAPSRERRRRLERTRRDGLLACIEACSEWALPRPSAPRHFLENDSPVVKNGSFSSSATPRSKCSACCAGGIIFSDLPHLTAVHVIFILLEARPVELERSRRVKDFTGSRAANLTCATFTGPGPPRPARASRTKPFLTPGGTFGWANCANLVLATNGNLVLATSDTLVSAKTITLFLAKGGNLVLAWSATLPLAKGAAVDCEGCRLLNSAARL